MYSNPAINKGSKNPSLELKILLFFRPEIIIMLVGNKIDKEEDRVVTTELGQAFA